MTATADTRQLTWLQRHKSLAAVISTSFGVGLSFGIGFPLTSLTFEAWQQANWMIGLAGAIPPIAIMFALPFGPRFITKVGPVAAILTGCICGALGFLALYLFQSPWAWLGIRFLMSLGFALPWLAGETWINSVSEEATRGRVIALYAMAFFLGFSIGPVLLQEFGLNGLWPFATAAIVTAASSLPIFLARKLAPEFHHDVTRNPMAVVRLVPAAMASGFIGGFAEITNLSLIPNVAIAAGRSHDEALALLTTLTIGGVILQFAIGWLSDKISRIAMTVALAAAFVFLVFVMPEGLKTLPTAQVLVFLLGGVVLGFYTLGLAVIGERVDAGALAAANAIFLVMYQAGAIVGPLAAGLAMTFSPVTGFVTTMIGLMLVGLAAVLIAEFINRRDIHAGSRNGQNLG
ncbi:MFS transporter [Hyphomicrobium methylovorum]|uniref:MFS transporter n=1 Tax=Hyphomicrobium methylovorum TaxID=84 RepID=UPI0015E67938|nr:MFS transporter [Hyphomicrobium methylovorum]MBA2125242.1 MFS transporter [Hyphomicrobium methylovorum]